MATPNAKKLRRRFTRMGEAATRAYLTAAIPKLRLAQREVAAAEAVLQSLRPNRNAQPTTTPAGQP